MASVKYSFLIIFLFLFSCSGIKDEIKIKKSIPPENFIKNQTEKIKKTLEMGPSQKKDGMKIKRQRKIIFTENNKVLKNINKKKSENLYYSKNFIPFHDFPGKDNKSLKTIKPNQKLVLLQKKGNWYHFLTNTIFNDSKVYGYVKPVFGNIRLNPSMNSKVIHIANKYQLFEIIDKQKNWYKVTYKVNAHGKLPIKLKLQESFNYHENPFKIGKNLGVFKKNEEVLVFEQSNNYLLISNSKNIGWINVPIKFKEIIKERYVDGWVHKNIIKKLSSHKFYSSVWIDFNKFSKDLTLNTPELKISVNFDDVSIKDAFKTLGDLSGRNILVGDDVNGFISAKLNNVNFETAFNSLLKLKSLGKIDEENITSIHNINFIKNYERSKNERITELTKLNKIKGGLEPLNTEIFSIYYAKAKDIKIQIDEVFGGKAEGLKSLSPEISVDERTNTLIVKGNKSQLNLTSQIIKNIDIKTDQILIEAFILEVNDDFEKKLGTRMGFSGNRGDFASSGLATGSPAEASGSNENTLALGSASGSVSNLLIQNAFGGIGLIMNPGRLSLKLELNALEKEGVTNILSNPRIFTLDNEMAIISQGVSVPRPGTSFGGGTITEFEPAELKLAVTPNVVGDGNIILDVEVDKDTPDFTRNPTSPPINTKKIKTKLLVKNNSIVVIGGIYSQTKSDSLEKVPGINELPIVGNAFKNNQNLTERRELLIFISPHIV
jgi:type IV pilus assembly protein PilQ